MARQAASLGATIAALAGRLQAAGIERARAEARLLAGAALGMRLEAIVAHTDRLLTAEEQASIAALGDRRVARQPMSQILGEREFYGRRFAVTPDVLTPRPDSETLIETVLQALPDRGAPLRLLDLGTGSGCLLLTLLAELPNATGVGVDLSAAALDVARGNARALGVEGRVAWHCGRWTDGLLEKFDVAVSNPPYIRRADVERLEPEVARYEPSLALDGGEDGLQAYRELAAELPGVLKPRALFALEVGFGQADEVARLMKGRGLAVLATRNDLAGIPRCILGAIA